ncbi:entericidin A/B family lipoprotein [Palleronia sediminis]|uniref:Entericidin A/B family lipoprotein n=1 Tax=Palleronia sediminis TaxID=2547833 RepID=A0A4R6AF87_9RHOB|nr:entericidin A/B family lipoprotein [Palleronia sediminis]TDL81845.1 entericidin A/B family lipoprotein [Palleronia sediminis]
MTTITRLAALFCLGVLAACETVGGAGQDIENAGEFIQQGSQEVQDDI